MTRAIFEHAARISRVEKLEDLIRLNADFARDLAGAERCSLWLTDEKTNEIWTMVAHGVETIRIPFGQGLIGACVKDDQVILVNDAEHEPPFIAKDRRWAAVTRRSRCSVFRYAPRAV